MSNNQDQQQETSTNNSNSNSSSKPNESDNTSKKEAAESTGSKDANATGSAHHQQQQHFEVQLPTALTQISNSQLEYAYSFWFSKRPSKSAAAAAAAAAAGGSAGGGGGGGGGGSGAAGQQQQNLAYDAHLRQVGTFNTVEKFWYLYAHMARPHDLQGHADIHMFKAGIRPLWEDEANKNGGKWIVRLKKGLATRLASSIYFSHHFSLSF